MTKESNKMSADDEEIRAKIKAYREAVPMHYEKGNQFDEWFTHGAKWMSNKKSQQTQSLQKQIEERDALISSQQLRIEGLRKDYFSLEESYNYTIDNLSQKDEMLDDLINQLQTNHSHLESYDKNYPHSVLKIHNEQMITQYQNSKK